MNKLRVLVVDDEQLVLNTLVRLVEMLFQERGQSIEILLAGDGEEGLTLLKKYVVDLVVTDIQMPRMSGTDMRVKNVGTSSEGAMFIFVSGSMENEEFKGTTVSLRKPVSLESLKMAVTHLFAMREARTRSARSA